MSFEVQLSNTIQVFNSLQEIRPQIETATRAVIACLKAGNKLLICGNGGSAAEASHFSTELVGRFAKTRTSLPAIAIGADTSLVTCIGNDFGFEQVFSRALTGLGQKGDLLVIFSSSGNSANILAALKEAKRLGIDSIAFLGRGGGPSKGLATHELIIPGDSGRAAQEAHLFLIHYMCEAIDAVFA